MVALCAKFGLENPVIRETPPVKVAPKKTLSAMAESYRAHAIMALLG